MASTPHDRRKQSFLRPWCEGQDWGALTHLLAIGRHGTKHKIYWWEDRMEQTTKMVSPDLIKQGVTRQHMKMWSECRGARGQGRYGNRGESVQHKCDEAVVLEPAKALVAGGLRRRGSAKASTHHRTSFVGCSLGCGKQARAARSSTGESHLSTGVAIVAVPLPLPDHPATEFARQ